MDEKQMSAFKAIMKELQDSRDEKTIDYRRLSAPCGLPCFECGFAMASSSRELQTMISEFFNIPLEQAVCKGCRDEGGKCAHLPMPCRLYPCAEQRAVEFCYECSDFPCDNLHPYADMAGLVWHNTKVFNLCLMKKMGVDAWARQKARSVRDTYYWGKWTL